MAIQIKVLMPLKKSNVKSYRLIKSNKQAAKGSVAVKVDKRRNEPPLITHKN